MDNSGELDVIGKDLALCRENISSILNKDNDLDLDMESLSIKMYPQAYSVLCAVKNFQQITKAGTPIGVVYYENSKTKVSAKRILYATKDFERNTSIKEKFTNLITTKLNILKMMFTKKSMMKSGSSDCGTFTNFYCPPFFLIIAGYEVVVLMCIGALVVYCLINTETSEITGPFDCLQ